MSVLVKLTALVQRVFGGCTDGAIIAGVSTTKTVAAVAGTPRTATTARRCWWGAFFREECQNVTGQLRVICVVEIAVEHISVSKWMFY